mmetsp:Transcript_20110/g.63993  ORF Transcript_20110/g.63993 Transcript_20110/m.63993 type:complete len:90 (-) Transcript_20110:110-379(-)
MAISIDMGNPSKESRGPWQVVVIGMKDRPSTQSHDLLVESASWDPLDSEKDGRRRQLCDQLMACSAIGGSAVARLCFDVDTAARPCVPH